MIDRKDYKLGIRETVSLILLIIGAKFSDMTPSLMFVRTEMASWIALILSAILFFISFRFLLSVVKKYPDKGLIEILEQVLGKRFGFIVGFLLFLIMISGTISDTRSYIEIISTLYYPNTPILILYVLFFCICLFVAKRGLEALGRTSALFIVWVKIILLLLIIMLWKKLEFSFLFPVLGRDPIKILTTGFKFIPIFGEIMLLTVLMTFFRSFENFKKATHIGFFLVAFELLAFWIFYITFYDVPTIKEISFLFHETTRSVSVGRFLTNPETIFLPIWLIAAFIRFSFYLYITTSIFGYLFKIREFEPLLFPFSAIIVLSGLIPENSIISEYYLRKRIIFEYGSFFFFFMPIILLVVQKWKERKS